MPLLLFQAAMKELLFSFMISFIYQACQLGVFSSSLEVPITITTFHLFIIYSYY